MIDNDSKPYWRYIKSRKQGNIGVAPLKDRGTLTSDSLQKVNIQLSKFPSVFTKEDSAEAISELQSTTIRHPLTNIGIQVNGVTKLKNLNSSKACGQDAIPNRVLSGCGEELSPGLSAVF